MQIVFFIISTYTFGKYFKIYLAVVKFRVVNLPVRAFISMEKAIKSAVELRTEFNLAGQYSYSIEIQFLRNNLIGNTILNYSQYIYI
jgi:hypothetical protein